MTRTEVEGADSVQTSRPPAYAAEELTHGGRQAWIEHSGQIYVLRITRAGKLILTK